MNPRFIDQDNIFFQEILAMLRKTALLMPFAILTLGLLVRSGFLDNSHYHSDLAFIVIAIGLLCTAVAQYILKPVSSLGQGIFLTLFHVFAVAFLLLISGLFSPFLICWIFLLIAADMYFGTRAFILSCLILYVTAWYSVALYSLGNEQEIFVVVVSCMFITAVGIVVSNLRIISDRERRALNQARKQEGFQRERLLALVNGMGDAVVTTDEKGIIRIYNSATLSLLDTNENITGKSIDNLLKLVDQNGTALQLADEVLKERTIFTRTDLSCTFKDGENMKLYINISPIRRTYSSKGESGYIIIMRDITKEKSLEEERDEFISVVSHELRTPIAISEGNLSNVQLLLKRGATNKSVTAAVDVAYEQLSYLAKMINDLGTLSRAERGIADTPEEIDIVDMIQTIYKSYLPQAEAKGLQLNIDIGPKIPVVHVSRLYLEEIMQNFVTNSLKYTKEGSITIRVHNTKGGIELSVKDSGIGISKSDQKHMFEKFFRSEDYRTRETSGTGLGLYVVHKLAEKLNTHVVFVSRLNHGSTFSFVLKNTKKARPTTSEAELDQMGSS